MKKKILIPILTGVLFAAVANAQEDITITGSTAARKVIYDCAASLFDAGYTVQSGPLSSANSGGTITASGTMSTAIPSLGSTPVTLRFAMSGSAQGLTDLNAQNPLVTKDPVTGNNSNAYPTIAFADNWPEACTPALSSSLFTGNTNLCVFPFTFFKNPSGPGMAGVTNITKEQAIMLATSSGTVAGFPAMQPDFLGGTTAGGPVYFMGRDIGSGTRISVFKDIGFTGTPRQWATNAANSMVLATAVAGVSGSGVSAGANGYSSGGTLAKVVNGLTTVNAIGYAGESDAATVGTGNWINYEGVACTHANVASGKYPIWCYEHIYARASSLTPNQQKVFDALVAAMTNPGYQATNSVFTNAAVSLAEMKVKRGVDGGSFTTTTAAGF